jgi:hypothetical protein
MLDSALLSHGQEMQMKNFHRIMRYWGVEMEVGVFTRKVTQAKSILENANLLRDNSKICQEELLFKSNLLLDYLKDILPQSTNQLDQILDRIETIVQKGVIPFASISDAALIMIVTLFPLYIDTPAVRFFTMLQIKEDLGVNLALLRKDKERFTKRLEKQHLLDRCTQDEIELVKKV